MGFFAKLLGRESAVPDWAAFFSVEEYAAFSAQLRHALAARSISNGAAQLSAGAVAVKRGSEDAALGFGPIARKCRGLEPEQWPALIAEHLDRALAPHDDLVAVLGADFDQARACLKVQLVPDGFVRTDWEEGLNFRTFGAGVMAALVYDLPTAVHTVPAVHARGWARSASELFALAAENVWLDADKPVSERVDIVEEGVAFEQLLGDSFFVCSHALWLERYPQAASDRGALVAVPSRHTVLFHPIKDASAWRALNTLPTVAAELHAKLPGPLSADLFWIKSGQVVDIPVRKSGGEIQVLPPESVMSLLADLREV